ncbi:MAG: methyltransferase domain-containing protein [Deltaproteobacteria bacterium]|nr:methyltransferase domain-containing protein [Deltaproteobacteria bacterium]
MLQLEEPAFVAQARLCAKEPFPPSWSTMEELCAAADRWMARLIEERSAEAARRGGLVYLVDAIDRAARTNKPENLDKPEVPAKKKQSIVQGLHRLNQAYFSYHRFVRILAPVVREVHARTGRAARVLELASGSGEFTLALARLAAKKKLPLSITGSDYIPEYVAEGNRRAKKQGLAVAFREVNAFAMEGAVSPGEFDVVFVSQSIHHFSPGQLAMMIAQSSTAATTAFVGVDGYRSLPLLGILPVVAAAYMRPAGVHDAWVTARKLYTQQELALAAKIAVPGAPVLVTRSGPFHSVLSVRFDLACREVIRGQNP